MSYRFGCYNKETQNDSDLNNTEISFLSPVKAEGHSPELVEQLHSHQRPRSRPPHFSASCTRTFHFKIQNGCFNSGYYFCIPAGGKE